MATRRRKRKLSPGAAKQLGKLIPPLSPTHLTPQQEGGTAADLRRLSPRQIGQVVLRQGGPQDEAQLAHIIGIVMCESSGNWDATSHNPDGGTNRGGWQIDDRAHPQYSATCLHSVICSTNAAKDISNGFKDFSAWACDHTARPYRQEARQALADLGTVESRATAGGLDLSGALGQIATVLEAIAKFFVGLGELLLTPEGWLRLGKLIGGALLIAMGVNRLAKLSLGVDPIGSITSGAFAAFPVGRGVVGKIGGIGRTAQEVANG